MALRPCCRGGTYGNRSHPASPAGRIDPPDCPGHSTAAGIGDPCDQQGVLSGGPCASTARLHAQVDAQQAAALVELDAAYDAKVAALESALKAARCIAGELATVAAAAEAVRGTTCSPTTLVHVAQSVATTLPLASTRPSVDVDVTLCFHGKVEVHAGAMGRLVTDKRWLQVASDAIDAVSAQYWRESLRM